MRKIFILNIALSLLGTTLFGQQASKDTKVLSVERNKADNTPTSVVFAADAGFHPGDAQALFRQYLGVGKQGDELVLYSTTKTKRNTTVYRYAQYCKGIKVEHSSYSVMVKDDKVSFITGNVYDIKSDISSIPVLNEGEALRKALDRIGAEKYMWQDPKMEQFVKDLTKNPDTTSLPKGKLVWIEDRAKGVGDRQLHLAYSFSINAVKPFSQSTVYVDATDGKILFVNSNIHSSSGSGQSLYSGTVTFNTTKDGGVYYLFDSTRGAGIMTIDNGHSWGWSSIDTFNNTSTSWHVGPEIDVHWGASKVYDYWYTQQGRNSYDNAGAMIKNYVHFGEDHPNAYWLFDYHVMIFGDGNSLAGHTPFVGIDITAHEIGHGVCQYTAGLIYEGEPGALNEGFSDIWAAVIENYADPHEVDAQPKLIWKFGEEWYGIARSFDTPKLQGQPDTYGGENWVDVTDCIDLDDDNDNCGVHINSGVLNHWFYLLCQGGTGVNDLGNSYGVTGIGMATAADIAYQTELILTSTADYASCRIASINAASTLFGPCSPEVQAVANAWYAVGVGPAFNPMAGSIAGPANVCVGASVTLTDTFSAGTWGSHATAIATVSGSGVVSGVSAGSAFITYAATTACGAFTDSFLVKVNAVPVPLTVTPAADTICNNGSIALAAPLAVLPDVNMLLLQDFNIGYGSWTKDSSGSSGYFPYGITTILGNGDHSLHSPDTSSFFAIPTEIPPGSVAKMRLVSPIFSLDKYTSANFSFQHFYKYHAADSNANVEISTDGGATWVTLLNYAMLHHDDATYTFSTRSFSLSPYLGMTNLRVRFYYVSMGGEYWFIDNVKVTGTPIATYAVPSWSPATDLFTDAGLTTPYTAGGRTNNVYTHPTTITAPTVRTYTATSTQAGCSSIGASLVSITPGSTFTSITAKPGITIKSGQSDTLQAVVAGAGTVHSYQWKVNGTYMAGATNATYISNAFANNDTVTCFVISDGPCGTITESKSVVIYISNLGVHDLSNGTEIAIMPNPNKGSFSVKGTLGDLNDENVTVEVTNMLGQTVYSKKFPVKNGVIDAHLQTHNLASGSYLLNLRSSNGSNVFRFVIEK